jgi:flagellar FliJ protein
MKFKFQFESVLRHRKILEDVAQRDFNEAGAIYRDEQKKFEELCERKAAANQRQYDLQKDGGKACPALSQVHDFLILQDLRIEQQQLKVQEALNIVEKLREILRQKAIDYKIIDKLKEKKNVEFKKDRSKLEQKRMDDLTVMRQTERSSKLRGDS